MKGFINGTAGSVNSRRSLTRPLDQSERGGLPPLYAGASLPQEGAR